MTEHAYTHDPAIPWTAKVKVTFHAIARARELLGWEGADHELVAQIRADVKVSLLNSRVTSLAPDWTTAGGHSSPGAFYAWDAEGTRCWVLRKNQTSRIVRVTSVLAARSDDDNAHRLRPGLTHR